MKNIAKIHVINFSGSIAGFPLKLGQKMRGSVSTGGNGGYWILELGNYTQLTDTQQIILEQNGALLRVEYEVEYD